jgi:hypothetical protein
MFMSAADLHVRTRNASYNASNISNISKVDMVTEPARPTDDGGSDTTHAADTTPGRLAAYQSLEEVVKQPSTVLSLIPQLNMSTIDADAAPHVPQDSTGAPDDAADIESCSTGHRSDDPDHDSSSSSSSLSSSSSSDSHSDQSEPSTEPSTESESTSDESSKAGSEQDQAFPDSMRHGIAHTHHRLCQETSCPLPPAAEARVRDQLCKAWSKVGNHARSYARKKHLTSQTHPAGYDTDDTPVSAAASLSGGSGQKGMDDPSVPEGTLKNGQKGMDDQKVPEGTLKDDPSVPSVPEGTLKHSGNAAAIEEPSDAAPEEPSDAAPAESSAESKTELHKRRQDKYNVKKRSFSFFRWADLGNPSPAAAVGQQSAAAVGQPSAAAAIGKPSAAAVGQPSAAAAVGQPSAAAVGKPSVAAAVGQPSAATIGQPTAAATIGQPTAAAVGQPSAAAVGKPRTAAAVGEPSAAATVGQPTDATVGKPSADVNGQPSAAALGESSAEPKTKLHKRVAARQEASTQGHKRRQDMYNVKRDKVTNVYSGSSRLAHTYKSCDDYLSDKVFV